MYIKTRNACFAEGCEKWVDIFTPATLSVQNAMSVFNRWTGDELGHGGGVGWCVCAWQYVTCARARCIEQVPRGRVADSVHTMHSLYTYVRVYAYSGAEHCLMTHTHKINSLAACQINSDKVVFDFAGATPFESARRVAFSVSPVFAYDFWSDAHVVMCGLRLFMVTHM